MNKIQKFLSVAFFIAIFVVLIYLIQNYGIEPLRNKIERMGIWAPFGIFILRGVSIILPALPSSAELGSAGKIILTPLSMKIPKGAQMPIRSILFLRGSIP